MAALSRLPCCGTSEAPSTLQALMVVRVNICVNTVLVFTHTHECISAQTHKTNKNLLEVHAASVHTAAQWENKNGLTKMPQVK